MKTIEVEKPHVILILDKIFLFILGLLFLYGSIPLLFLKDLVNTLGFEIIFEAMFGIAVGIFFIFLAIKEKQKTTIKTRHVKALKGIHFAMKSYILYMAIVFFLLGLYFSFKLKNYFFLIFVAISIFLFWVWNSTKYKYKVIEKKEGKRKYREREK